MKLEHADYKSMTSDDFKTTAFRVDQKMAQIIFRDKLYSAEGRLRIIAQEYMANARDAHRAAGKSDTPIEVTLPTALNPEFVVRDFGEGIPPEIVNDIFVVYGASTKNTSNEFNGGYGIGAKCAFSYVSAFAVTTTVKGVRYIYSAFIDNDGMNQFTLLDTGPATGPDGTEIRVPIAVSDHGQLHNWVRELTQFWTPRPVITPAPTYRSHTFTDHGAGWWLGSIRDSLCTMQYSPIIVLVDDIPYGVSEKQAAQLSEDVLDLYKALSSCSLQCLFSFRVAEITVPPNRESIDLSKKTREALTKRISSFMDHAVAHAKNRVSEAADSIFKLMEIIEEKDPLLQLVRKMPIGKFAATLDKVFAPEQFGMDIYEGNRRYGKFREFELYAQSKLSDLFGSNKHGEYTNTFILNSTGRPLRVDVIKKNCVKPTSGKVRVVVLNDPTKLAALPIKPDDFKTAGYHIVERLLSERRRSSAASGYMYIPTIISRASMYSDSIGLHDYSGGASTKRTYTNDSFWTSNVFVERGATADTVKIKGASVPNLRAGHMHAFLKRMSLGDPFDHVGSVDSTLYVWQERFDDIVPYSTEITYLDNVIDECMDKIQSSDLRIKLRMTMLLGKLPEVNDWLSCGSANQLVGLFKYIPGYSELFYDALSFVQQVDVRDSYLVSNQVEECVKYVDAATGGRLSQLTKEMSDLYAAVIKEVLDVLTQDNATYMMVCMSSSVGSFYDLRNGERRRVEWSDLVKDLLARLKPINPIFVKE